jgi:hypothetical protein
VVIVAATLGWPGSPVFEARGTLVGLGLPDPLHFIGTAAILLSLAYYVRLLAVGLLTPTDTVRRAGGDWPHWPHLARETDESVEAAARTASPLVLAVATNLVELEDEASGDDEGVPHRRPNLYLRHRLAAAWRLNRPLETSLLVLATATIAAIVAFGGFGASDASQSGITLDDAAAPPPNPSGLDNGGQPTDTPSAEPTAVPTLQLAPSAPPLASPSPSDSPSATPTATATTGN